MRRTLQLPLNLTPEQLQELKATQEAYARVFNAYAEWFQENKTTAKGPAHRALYQSLLGGLSTGLHQAARDQASESTKAFNSRWPKKKWLKPVRMSRGKQMRYDRRTISIRGTTLTYSTTGKRTHTTIEYPQWWRERYPNWSFKAGTIGLDKHGQPVAHLIFESPETAPNPRREGKVVGLDRGLYNLYYSSEGSSMDGRPVRAVRRRRLFQRRELSHKGTRSANRRLRALSGRESRFMRDVNHQASKRLAQDKAVRAYVLEDLSGLSKQKVIRYQKHRNKRLSDWAHAQLLKFLTYKCEAEGIKLVFVDPAFTSQDCSRCGHRSKSNRDRGRFYCLACGFTASADFNAAVNIKQRATLAQLLPPPGDGQVCQGTRAD